MALGRLYNGRNKMWILILIATNINNPADIPARVNLEFKSEADCLHSLKSMKVWNKFDSFKITGECKESK